MKLSTFTLSMMVATVWALGLGGCGASSDDDTNGDAQPAGAECGNGSIEAGEACDDGNTEDGDGCTAACQLDGDAPDVGVDSPDVGVDSPDVSVEPSPDAGSVMAGPVVINEIVAKDAADGPDWIELYNSGDASVDLAGWTILDFGRAAEEAFVFSPDTAIAAGDYLVIEKDTDFGFGLGGADTVELFDASGALIDTTSWVDGDAPAGSSWGRSPNGTGAFQTLQPVTRGAANPGDPIIPDPPTGELAINEIVAAAAEDGPDWIELFNPGDADVVMTGWTLGDSGTVEADRFVFADDSVLAAGDYAVLIRGETFEFGIGGADGVTLYNADGAVVDTTSWSDGDAETGSSWGRNPNGSGPFETLMPPTPGAENAGGPPLEYSDVVLNEIAADAGDLPDWVELYNQGDAEADISGWTMSDDGEGVDHIYAFPEGTLIAAGDFFVVERDGGFPFGLGGADGVHLFDADGELVDETQWAEGESPEGASWARFPDGSGPFATRSASRGAANGADGPVPPVEAVCGDGNLDEADGEECDDGNVEPGDGCDADCAIEPACGDGNLDEAAGETCDDGNVEPGDGCDADCAIEPVCGDGNLDEAAGETCDDGNVEPGDGCDAVCAIEPAVCGDGVQQDGEACDDGNVEPGDGCDALCALEAGVCGDGTLNEGEDCDDGNVEPGDGCDAVCALEPGVCGDGTLDDGEACDDGNVEPGDGCDAACAIEPGVCGDGTLDDGEACDDGNVEPGDGCDAGCVVEVAVCGDGVVDHGEFCDDGNLEPNDGCDADCAIEPRGAVINEVVARALDDGPDWIELYNDGDVEIDLTGWSITDDGEGPDHTQVFAAGPVIAAGDFALLERGIDFAFGLGGADAVRLYNADGVLVDETTWLEAVAGQSWGRSEDGSGDFVVLEPPTPGAANSAAP